MTDEVVDAEVVESQELAVTESATLFHTSDPVQVIEKATEVANALKQVVDKQGLIARIQGKEHPLVEAWQTLGMMLGVTAVVVKTEAVTDRHGKPGYKAEVEARFKGEVIGKGDALCSTSESRWKNADDYAILSMAQTRATSKALSGPLRWVMKLAGFEPTPAEEMPTEPDAPSTRAREGRDIPSADQIKFLIDLLKQRSVSSANQKLIRTWADSNLKRSECSATITALKDGTPEQQVETYKALVKRAGEWAAKQTDLPADTEGL